METSTQLHSNVHSHSLRGDNYDVVIKTCDMHTAGEPFRIVEEGYPNLMGNNILEKRAYAMLHYDTYRKLIMNEPRGHKDMYGAILTKPTHPDAHLAVLFIHNEGYSTMCGHGVIALGRYAIDKGYVTAKSPETEVILECPCGIVNAYVTFNDRQSGRVRFQSVPAFVFKLDAEVKSERLGVLKVDIAYGGAFYAIIDVSQICMDIENTALSVLVDAASDITNTVKSQISLYHPDSTDLAFLYGTILTDGKDKNNSTKNICVFADKEVDRSPTGSGVTARMAVQFKRGYVLLEQEKEFKSLIGTTFTGKVVRETKCGSYEAVVVEVSGMAYYTGESIFRLEKGDPFISGFVLDH